MEEEPERVVDSHVHFWDQTLLHYPWLSHEPRLGRAFLPADLAPETADLDGRILAGVVAVQADCLAAQAPDETAWLHGLADNGAPVLGIVAHASLERGRVAPDELGRHPASSLVAGVRRLLQDEAAGFSLTPGFVEGVGALAGPGWVMDLCVRRHQLREMVQLVQRCPDVEFVLDHLGKPLIEPSAFAEWAGDLAGLARLPNVRCKLSGLSTETTGPSTSSTFQPWLRHALEAFGPQRCLFGSDWPVVTLGVGYRQWYEIVLEALADLTDEERSGVLSGNALAVYDPPKPGARAKES